MVKRRLKSKLQAASDKPYQINYDDFCKGDEDPSSKHKPQANEELEGLKRYVKNTKNPI